MKFDRESFQLPLNLKLGGAYSASRNLLFALDINKPVDNDIILNAGTEYIIEFHGAISIAARLGYKTDAKGFAETAGVTAGTGIKYRDIGFDYAFVPYGELDSTHRISLKIIF